MLGKLFRHNQDGYIYEVVGQDETSGSSPGWILWNERAGQRQTATEVELARQVGWELVGTAVGVRRPEPSDREIPAALMK